jgi:hypothetical protein
MGLHPYPLPVGLNTTPYQGRPATIINTALGSQDLDLRLQKDGTNLLTPNMPSCYDRHRKDSTKSGRWPLRFSEQPRGDVTI